MDTTVLCILSYLLLRLFDLGGHSGLLLFLLLAFACCIFLLGYLIVRYMNLPQEKEYHSFFD